MAADERKVVGWFTANGKHIPIFDGGPTFAEKKKDSDIAKAKEQADILNGKQFKKNSSGDCLIQEGKGIHNSITTSSLQ